MSSASNQSGPATPEPTFRPSPGAILSDRYVLEAEIERGAAGEVWRGRHAAIGKRVAIKVLKAEHANDEDDWAIKRMLREARLLSEIQHYAVVGVLDFGEQGGCPYIVMELLEGRTLAKALKEGPMPWAKAGPLMAQMAEGLEAAHRVGVIHRDLKPANIVLLDQDSRAKIIDFGIAGALGRTRITMDGEVLGTPHFMSPEQSKTMDLTATSDVYSFGCMAFAMLVGRPPYVGKVVDIVRGHLGGPIPAVCELVGPDVPREVCLAIQRSMAKDPEQRFQTMGEFHDALLGRPIGTARGATTARTRARTRTRKRGVATALAAGGTFSLGLFAAAVVLWRQPEVAESPDVGLPVTRPASVAAPAPVARPQPETEPPTEPHPPELPVEVATPKSAPVVPETATEAQMRPDRPQRRRPRERKQKPHSAGTEQKSEPVAQPAPKAPDLVDSVEKVGGLKNPFDAE